MSRSSRMFLSQMAWRCIAEDCCPKRKCACFASARRNKRRIAKARLNKRRRAKARFNKRRRAKARLKIPEKGSRRQETRPTMWLRSFPHCQRLQLPRGAIRPCPPCQQRGSLALVLVEAVTAVWSSLLRPKPCSRPRQQWRCQWRALVLKRPARTPSRARQPKLRRLLHRNA